MMYTSFKEKSKCFEEITGILGKLDKIIENSNIVISTEGEILNSDTYHYLAGVLQPKTPLEKTLYGLMLKYAYQAELMSAGSAHYFFLYFVSLMREFQKHKEYFEKTNEVEFSLKLDSFLSNFSNKLTTFTCHASPEEMEKHIKNICDDNNLAAAIHETVTLAGLEGKIHIEDSTHSNSYSCEQKTGYVFKSVTPFNFLLPTDGIWDRKGVKVFLVDGIIEKVSEIDKILNGAMNSKTPMIFVAHGFSEEVVATIRINNNKKNFDIMPLKLSSDLESINVINDLAVVSGTDIVSTLKGQMLCFVKFSDIAQVDRVKINLKDVVLENNSTKASVSSHLRTLLEKRNENHTVSDIHILIDKRIQSLLSSSVVLKLPLMDSVKRNNIKVKIDSAFRGVKSLLTYGYIENTNNFFNEPEEDEIFSSVNNILKNITKETKNLPSLTFFSSVHFSLKLLTILMFSSGLIELD